MQLTLWAMGEDKRPVSRRVPLQVIGKIKRTVMVRKEKGNLGRAY